MVSQAYLDVAERKLLVTPCDRTLGGPPVGAGDMISDRLGGK